MSREPSPRPFRLSDALVLIAAAALGFAVIKFVDTLNDGLFRRGEFSEHFPDNWIDWVMDWNRFLTACCLVVALMVTPLSLALLGLRLLKPRSRLRRIWRQPGAVACLTCLLPLVLLGLTLGGQAIVGRSVGIAWRDIDFTATYQAGAGFGTLAVWIVLWLGRIGRPEKSWIDRSGRVLGVVMIALFLTASFVPKWLVATIPRQPPFALPPPPPAPSLDYPPTIEVPASGIPVDTIPAPPPAPRLSKELPTPPPGTGD